MWPFLLSFLFVKGGVREKWKGIWAYGESNRFWSLLILLLSVASIRRELLKTTYSEECSVHTNSESCNLYDSNCKIINFILNKSFRYCNLWSSNIFRRIQLMFHNFLFVSSTENVEIVGRQMSLLSMQLCLIKGGRDT